MLGGTNRPQSATPGIGSPCAVLADSTAKPPAVRPDGAHPRICAARGIHLAVIHPEDLTLERMRQKVKGHLPLRDLAGHEAVVAYLEKTSRDYRRKARAGRFRGVG